MSETILTGSPDDAVRRIIEKIISLGETLQTLRGRGRVQLSSDRFIVQSAQAFR